MLLWIALDVEKRLRKVHLWYKETIIIKVSILIEVLDPDQGRQKSSCALLFKANVECYAECRISYFTRVIDEL